jgi:23S rRNA (adenine2503-C2)-methyltransferase
VGLPSEIRRLAQEGLQIRLAVSLHAATDAERSALLPINKRYPLGELVDAVREYIALTGRRVTFEWALVAGQNDTPEQGHALGQLLRGLNAHVNLIPLNPTSGYSGKPPSRERVEEFVAIIESYHVPATVRVRRGIDIHAGCGQLRADVLRHSSSL